MEERQNIENTESSARERAVPFSREAELSVLGAMLLDEQCIPEAINICKADDFYIDRHKELFLAIVDLHNMGKPIDIVTIKEQLTLRGSFDAVGGMGFVMETMNMVPTTGNIKHYAKIVSEKATLRKLIKMADQISDSCYSENEDLEAILGSTQQKMINITAESETTGPVHIRKPLGQLVENISELSDRGEDITGISTGFIDIDKRTAGFHGSELIIIAARPGAGKTSFALNIAQNAATGSGVTVAIFNLEMPAVQLVARMLSSESMVTAEALKKGDIKDDEWEKIGEAVDVLGRTNIYIDDTSTITVEEICARCRKLKLEHNLGMVVIDYIQLISDNRKDGNRMKAIEDISRSLKLLSKDLNIPVIALSQLNRSVEKREVKEPVLSDLRESGAIEQDADMVLFLSREGAYNPDVEEPNKTKCAFAKHRGGETGYEYLTWLGEYTKFSNWSGMRDD